MVKSPEPLPEPASLARFDPHPTMLANALDAVAAAIAFTNILRDISALAVMGTSFPLRRRGRLGHGRTQPALEVQSSTHM